MWEEPQWISALKDSLPCKCQPFPGLQCTMICGPDPQPVQSPIRIWIALRTKIQGCVRHGTKLQWLGMALGLQEARVAAVRGETSEATEEWAVCYKRKGVVTVLAL